MQKGEVIKRECDFCNKTVQKSKGKKGQKGLPNFGRYGIILERQGPPERMTSDRLRSKKIGTTEIYIMSAEKFPSFRKSA